LQNGIVMTDVDEYNLMQFLKCLTDSSFLREPRLSRPS
jgi:hypothetical protein